MKNIILRIVVLVISFGGSLYAFENKLTHPAKTKEATDTDLASLDDYLKTTLDLDDGLTTQLYWNFPVDIKTRIARGKAIPDKTTRTIQEWVKVGSIIEDTEQNWDNGRWKVPWRPRHHFHDPTRPLDDAGLDNHEDHRVWKAPLGSSWLPLGTSALVWATYGYGFYDPYSNDDNWGTARTIFYQALTESDNDTREARLAESLMKLGWITRDSHLLFRIIIKFRQLFFNFRYLS